MGLFKSIRKYNGKHNFMNYSSIYIKYELLGLLTEKYSLSILPKNIRRKNKSAFSKRELINYKFMLNTKFTTEYEDWKIELLFSNKEDNLNDIIKKDERYTKMNTLFNNLTSFSKRVFYLKYYLHFNKNISNQTLSTLMCCSEETIRKHLIEIKQTANTL